MAMVSDWKEEPKSDYGFGPDDPLFPKTVTSFASNGEVLPPRFVRECWANAAPIRRLFKLACAAAGVPYFHPHSLRHTLAQWGSCVCTTPAEYKAWSQNLGHDGVLVPLLTSYGTIPDYSQRELIRSLGRHVMDNMGTG